MSLVLADIPTETNFKVAFLADTAAGTNFKNVLQLVEDEQADLVLIPGDLQYSTSSVSSWVTAVHDVLGDNFPLLVSRGNHEPEGVWGDLTSDTCSGTIGTYSEFIKCRLNAMGVTPNIDNTRIDRYSAVFGGFKMVFLSDVDSDNDEGGQGKDTNDDYAIAQLSDDNYIWKVCLIHENQRATNVGPKGNQVGWPLFEACRENGAFIGQGHSHTYSRSKTLTNMESQTIDNTCLDIPSTPQFDNCVRQGASFFFDASLGGKSKRDLENTNHDYWAKYYNSQYGALFIEFNVDGDPYKARGYFKNIDNEVIDEFEIHASSSGNVTDDPPIRSNPQPTGTLSAGTTQTTINLTTNEAATCKYSTTPNVAYSSMTNTFTTTGGTAHSNLITGLSDGNSYYYYVKCKDNANNENTDDFLITFSIDTSNECVGNVNFDNEVNIFDIIEVIKNWGPC